MKRKAAIAVAALILLIAGGSGFSGCASSTSGEAKSDVEDGMYDVTQYFTYKNPKTDKESYYFLINTNEGELRTIRIPKKDVKEVKTRQSSYISVREGAVTFFIHDEALAKPDLPADKAYEKRFSQPAEQPRQEPKEQAQPKAIQPAFEEKKATEEQETETESSEDRELLEEKERDRIFDLGWSAGYDVGYRDGLRARYE